MATDLSAETRQLLNKYRLNAKKKFGQNFLINSAILDKIVETVNIEEGDLLIEIGPGLGTLTNELIRSAGKVICIELDSDMVDVLNNRFATVKNLEIINDDILKLDLREVIKQNDNVKNVKVVANLPYYITTPIVMKLLEEYNDVLQRITIMVQKEVANRLVSNHAKADKGAITYTIDYYSNSMIVEVVPASSFLPAPKVDSAVVDLKLLDKPNVEVKDKKKLFDIIKFSFLQKRKTLVNSLSNSGIMNKEEIVKVLNGLGLNEKVRPEELTLQDFANIAMYI